MCTISRTQAQAVQIRSAAEKSFAVSIPASSTRSWSLDSSDDLRKRLRDHPAAFCERQPAQKSSSAGVLRALRQPRCFFHCPESKAFARDKARIVR